ncbi:acetoacetate decarboxylase family protein [Halococcoides cellulosivorans]|uniref:Acetoacetate decarboxylase n=1 Tax=Halococcoides cellulosivorans TaxID=1679096 RepID=A0A2R4X1M5_9EURY|nr:acetoacetate decarboxylase family protein [Halococcoides cellulosivorans]AWB27696.1 acetoacetate decarboxylase [Halococcoides cellulosivorans]
MTGADREPHSLSTGHTVGVPLDLEATITGAVFAAPLDDLRAMVPDGLRPVRLTPRRGGITILSVDYHRIGDDAMAPYNEVSIQIPATREGSRTVPVVSGLLGATGGYVWAMPVTTEPAKALGREVWGYPKTVADIAIDHGERATQTTVSLDGDRVLTMDVTRPPAVPLRVRGHTYTELDGRLVREDTAIRGRVGAWPLSQGATVEVGSRGFARQVPEEWFDGRALLRLAADCRFRIEAPRPV